MGLGFKYHVVTIAAIFFALTIGLVVGSLYASPHVPRTMQTAIDALKRAQSTLDQSNHDLKQERDTLQNTLHQALPYALRNQLSSHTVALIQSSDNGDALTDLRDTLLDAGATVVSTVTIDHPFAQPDELLLPRLQSLREHRADAPASRAELVASIASLLKSGDDSHTPTMPALQKAGLLHYEAKSDFTRSVNTVILLTGSPTESSTVADNIDIPLITAIMHEHVAVYACETQGKVASNFPRYGSAHLTVHMLEKVDTDIGKWQLVKALGEE